MDNKDIATHFDEFFTLNGNPSIKEYFDWNRHRYVKNVVYDLGAKRDTPKPEDPNELIAPKYPDLSENAIAIARFLSNNGPSTAKEISSGTGIDQATVINRMKKDIKKGFEYKKHKNSKKPTVWKYNPRGINGKFRT